MPRMMQQSLPGVEVNKVDDLEGAKVHVGRAVKDAIGDDGLKAFGDKGQISKVVTGERVPNYLARIYQDVDARRRFGLALLKGDPAVRIRMVIDLVDWES